MSLRPRWHIMNKHSTVCTIITDDLVRAIGRIKEEVAIVISDSILPQDEISQAATKLTRWSPRTISEVMSLHLLGISIVYHPVVGFDNKGEKVIDL